MKKHFNHLKFFLRQNFILILILVLAFLTRFVGVTKNPAGFFCDEASVGYNAYTIWTQGKDEYGKRWPVFFKAFGEYKNPVIIYSLAPIVGLFGLSELPVRSVAVFYGVLSIIAIYLLTKIIFNKKAAILASLFLAISPWYIHFGRVAFQLTTSVFWVTFSLYLLKKSTKSFKYYPFALVSLIIAFLSYYSPRLYLPPLVLFFLIINYKTSKNWLQRKEFCIFNTFALMAFLLILGPSLANGTFFTRWKQVRESTFSLKSSLQSYFNHFSIDFLFKKGNIDLPGQFVTRHSVRGIGELYWFQLPLLIAGLTTFFVKKYKKRQGLYLTLAWLTLYPLGSMFTSTTPQATRSIIGVVPFQILSAAGYFQISQLINKYLPKFNLHPLFALIVIISFFHLFTLMRKYPLYSSDYWGWQFGPREIISEFINQKDNYDQMCMGEDFNSPHIFINFYDPEDSCNGKCQICKIEAYKKDKKQLFALSKDTFNKLSTYKDFEFDTKKTIYYPNGDLAFLIGEVKKDGQSHQ